MDRQWTEVDRGGPRGRGRGYSTAHTAHARVFVPPARAVASSTRSPHASARRRFASSLLRRATTCSVVQFCAPSVSVSSGLALSVAASMAARTTKVRAARPSAAANGSSHALQNFCFTSILNCALRRFSASAEAQRLGHDGGQRFVPACEAAHRRCVDECDDHEQQLRRQVEEPSRLHQREAKSGNQTGDAAGLQTTSESTCGGAPKGVLPTDSPREAGLSGPKWFGSGPAGLSSVHFWTAHTSVHFSPLQCPTLVVRSMVAG